jgi:hypothetical protein
MKKNRHTNKHEEVLNDYFESQEGIFSGWLVKCDDMMDNFWVAIIELRKIVRENPQKKNTITGLYKTYYRLKEEKELQEADIERKKEEKTRNPILKLKIPDDVEELYNKISRPIIKENLSYEKGDA